jgi:hypothetical protein
MMAILKEFMRKFKECLIIHLPRNAQLENSFLTGRNVFLVVMVKISISIQRNAKNVQIIRSLILISTAVLNQLALMNIRQIL